MNCYAVDSVLELLRITKDRVRAECSRRFRSAATNVPRTANRSPHDRGKRLCDRSALANRRCIRPRHSWSRACARREQLHRASNALRVADPCEQRMVEAAGFSDAAPAVPSRELIFPFTNRISLLRLFQSQGVVIVRRWPFVNFGMNADESGRCGMCSRPSPSGAIGMLARRQGYASDGASSNVARRSIPACRAGGSRSSRETAGNGAWLPFQPSPVAGSSG